MRNAFRDAVAQAAAADERVVLLSGDIGNRMFDGFKADFPDRFYNCGIAEQNMVGMAAGLAMSGLRPVCYTIANFLTYRVIEQIRVDCCYHGQPVVLAGVGGGLSYASLGATHHTCEDLAMLRSLPGMHVLTPGDAVEVRALTAAALRRDDGPTYLRLGKKGEPVVHKTPPAIGPGRWSVVLGDVAAADHVLLACGNVLPVALESNAGCVVSCGSVKPLDEALLAEVFGSALRVTTFEEHGRDGGFGSAVLEWLHDHRPNDVGKLRRVGTPDAFLHEAGDQTHARRVFGLTAEQVAADAAS